MRVLLIEDSRFIRVAVEQAMVKAGHNVTTSRDGDAGLQMARIDQPDLILLDMMLPGLPGLDVLRALKTQPVTKKIPVIVLTSLSERNSEKLLEEGAAGYIEKCDRIFDNNAQPLVRAITELQAKVAL
jgi:DNA-binding response OmpR family regulator